MGKSILFALLLLLSSPIVASGADLDSSNYPTVRMPLIHTLTTGGYYTINISLTDPVPIGSFRLLLTFDPVVLNFLSAQPIGDLENWEFFTYQYSKKDTGDDISTGFIRLAGIADLPDGQDPNDVYQPAGEIIKLYFNVTSNNSFVGLCALVGFYWEDCGDNIFINVPGDTAYADLLIYHHSLYWDEENDEEYPEGDRPAGLGTADSCLDYFEQDIMIRNMRFQSGYICLKPLPVLGPDVNLNGIEAETGDVVLLANYFIFGPIVFHDEKPPDYYEMRWLAADIDCDGQVTVADLVHFVRIISGEYVRWSPGYKIAPGAVAVDVNYTIDDETVMSVRSPVDVGAAAFVFHHTGVEVGTPALSDEAVGMTIGSSDQDGVLRVLVYSLEGNSIQAGEFDLFTVPVSGEGTIEPVEVQLSDASGNLLTPNMEKIGPPASFELLQNYPNPFNASTTIGFTLPVASEWNLRIYDVAGRLVNEFAGFSPAGRASVRWDATEAASGIYFYKLTAGDFTNIKKMVLLK